MRRTCRCVEVAAITCYQSTWSHLVDRKALETSLVCLRIGSLQNRRISGASAIQEGARETRERGGLALRVRARASRARSYITLAPLIRLFCRLTHRTSKWQSISFVKISFFIKVEMMLWFRKLENFLSLFVSAYLYVILLQNWLSSRVCWRLCSQ